MSIKKTNIIFENKKKEFYHYLSSAFATSEEKKYTHTSINDPKGAWHIDDESLNKFYENYVRYYYKYDIKIHLTEKHKNVSPLLIDLDFKYIDKDGNRKFDINFIKELILIYNKIILELYENIEDKELESYVLLKDNSILNNKENNVYKDGIHIIYPFFVNHYSDQKYIRHKLLNNYKKELDILFKDFKCINDYNDIFDESVIYDTNWQLYGSNKPNNIKYKLKYILDIEGNIKENKYKEYSYENELELTKLFSIRNKKKSKLILKKNPEMEKWLDEINIKKIIEKNGNNELIQTLKSVKKDISQITIFGQPGTDIHLKYIENLVECLSEKRADNEKSWFNVGVLLHNIDYRLLNSWIDFSKLSNKFVDGECEKLWDRLPVYYNKNDTKTSNELTIGSLIHWCKEDNLDKYNEIKNKHFKSIESVSFSKLLYKSTSLTHTDLSNVIYNYFNGYGNSAEIRFMCYNIPKKLWCEFRQHIHRWHEDSEENPGNCIRSTFDKEIYRIYEVDYNRSLTDKIEKAIEDDDAQEQERISKIKEKVSKLVHSLKITSYRDTLLKECSHKFFYPDIREKFDTQNELICFANGVYDLEKNEFRKGRPDDFITLTTNINYKKYSKDSPQMKQLMNILKKILPIDRVREYFLLILSSCLSGKNWFEKFFVLTGTGANGKSKLLEFINNCFGDYFHQMNVSALCSKRAASNQADPELALLRAKRIVIFQEPTLKMNQINVGKLKEWTNNNIQTRELYKSPIKFKAQAKWFLICNDIPEVPSDDEGTWRRLTIINFPSKFVDKHNISGREYEYVKDPNIGNHLDELKDTFMSLLIDYYNIFKEKMDTTGIDEPEEVKLSTENERKKNNPMKQFFDDKIIYSSNSSDTINLASLYTQFKDFMIENNYSLKLVPRREDFKLKFNNHYPNIIKKNTNENIKVQNNLCLWTNIKILVVNNEKSNESESENKVNSNLMSDSDCDSQSDSDSD